MHEVEVYMVFPVGVVTGQSVAAWTGEPAREKDGEAYPLELWGSIGRLPLVRTEVPFTLQ